jgi:DNA-binding transcriptional ArsR family regulator
LPTPEPSGGRVDAVFGALADPTRRYLIEALSTEPGSTATTLAAGLPITRQAVAKHLAALAGAGLVHGTRAGREMRYEVDAAALGDAAEWITAVGAEWDARLARLRTLFEPDR